MTLSMIYARSANYCIGKDGRIPWHLPDEFAHFKRTTLGKPIIMGRKTYEDHQSALPGRLNIVVSRQADYKLAEGVVLAPSLDAAIKTGFQESDEVFIIGGVQFFVEAMPLADTVYETIIDADINGEAILPAFDFDQWDTQKLSSHAVDERHRYAYTVYKHQRRVEES
jgi:dihydrofolate reductase